MKQLSRARAFNAASDALVEENSSGMLLEAAAPEEKEEEEDSAIVEDQLQDHLSESLMQALNKLRSGSQANMGGWSSHADLRGFEGEAMNKEVFVREVRSQLGVRLTTEEAEILFWYFDSDHGGTVSFIEMLTKIQRPKKFMLRKKF